MLSITIGGGELFNEETMSFEKTKTYKLSLEHSLVSLSKWESKWEKPFLESDKTDEEVIDYIRCMTITQNIPYDIYYNLSKEELVTIQKYIQSKQSATWFNESKKTGAIGTSEKITSEIIYYWMFAHNIPMECQKWHLNKLLTLIKVCNLKNQPPKKKTRSEVIAENHRLNQERRKKYNTTG